MIIDTHTHIFPDKIAGSALHKLSEVIGLKPGTNGTYDGLRASMDEAGIDVSLILPVVTSPHQFDSILRFAVFLNENFSECEGPRLISFGGIHPECSDYKVLLRQVKNAGFKRIIYAASELGLIVLTHTGFDPYTPGHEYCTPDMILDVLKDVAPPKLILAHMGSNENYQESMEKLCGQNVWLDTAYSIIRMPENELVRMIHMHGADKVLFATDSPWAGQKEAVYHFKNLSGLSEKEKKRTVFAIPFMSCGAKITVYAAFIPVFFPKRAFPTVLFLYLLGVAVAVIYFCVRHSFGDKNAAEPYISELPLYRLPTLSDLFSRVFLRVGDFLSKAFGIILLSSVLVWFLTYFDFSLCHASPDESILASVGKFVSPIFTFCGFSSWQAAAAIISGFLSKESVVATLFVLTGKTGGLPSVFPSSLSAMSFLIFVLLYPPCVAALSVLKRETGVFRTAAAVIFQFAAALILCSAFYGVSTLFS